MRRNNCWLAVLAVSTALPILRHSSARERAPLVYGSRIDRSKPAYHADRGSSRSVETDPINRDETSGGPVPTNSLSENDRQTGWITSSSPDVTWRNHGHANLAADHIDENAGAKKSVDAGSEEDDSTGSIDSQAFQDRSKTANEALASVEKTWEPVSTLQVSGERRLSWIYREKVNVSPGTIGDVIHKDRETVSETSAIPEGRSGIPVGERDRQGSLPHQGLRYYGHVESSSRDDDTVTWPRGDGGTRTGFENSPPEDGESRRSAAGDAFDGVDIGFDGSGIRERSGRDSGSRYAIGDEDRFGRRVSIGGDLIQDARGKIRGSVRGGDEGIRKKLDELQDSLRRDGDAVFAKSRRNVDLEELGSLGLKKAKSRKKIDVDRHDSGSLRSATEEADDRKKLDVHDHGSVREETNVFAKSRKKLDVDQYGSEFFRPLNKEDQASAKTTKRLSIHQQVSDIFRSKKKEARVFAKSRKKLKVVVFSDSRKSDAAFKQTKEIVDRQQHFLDSSGSVAEDKKLDVSGQLGNADLRGSTEAEAKTFQESKIKDATNQPQFSEFVEGEDQNLKEQSQVSAHWRSTEEEEEARTSDKKADINYQQQFTDFRGSREHSKQHKIEQKLFPHIATSSKDHSEAPEHLEREFEVAFPASTGRLTNPPNDPKIQPRPRSKDDSSLYSLLTGKRRDRRNAITFSLQSGSTVDPRETGLNPVESRSPGSGNRSPGRREDEEDVSGREETPCKSAAVSSVSPEQRSTVNSLAREDNSEPCPIPADPATIPGLRSVSDRPSTDWKNAVDPAGIGFQGLAVTNEFLAGSATTSGNPSDSTPSLKGVHAALIARAADPADRSDIRRVANENLRVEDFDGIDCAVKNAKLSGPNDRDKDNRVLGTDRSNYTANEDRRNGRDAGCPGENQRNTPTDRSEDLKFKERGDKGNGQMARATDTGSYGRNNREHRGTVGRFSEDYGRDRADDGQSSGKSDGGFSMSVKEDGELAQKFDYRGNRGDDGEFSGRSAFREDGRRVSDRGSAYSANRNKVERGNIDRSILNEGLVRLTGDNEENGARIEGSHDTNNRKDNENFSLKSDIEKTNQGVSLHSTGQGKRVQSKVLNHETSLRDNGDSTNRNNISKDDRSAWNSDPINPINRNNEISVPGERLHLERKPTNNVESDNGLANPRNHNKRNGEQSAYTHEPSQSTSNNGPANLPTPAKETAVESSTGPLESLKPNGIANETSVSIDEESSTAKDNRAGRTKTVSSSSADDTTNKNNDEADKEARVERVSAYKKAKKEAAVASSMKRSTSKDATKESGNAAADSERGGQAIGRNSAYTKSDMNAADVERESRFPRKKDGTAGDDRSTARRTPAKGYPRNSNDSENPGYRPTTEVIINPVANETVLRGSSKTVAKGAKAESISLEPNHRRRVNERVDGLAIVSGSSDQNRDSMTDAAPVADLVRTQTQESRSWEDVEPSSTTSSDSLSDDASSVTSSKDATNTSGTTEDQSVITTNEPVTPWIEDTSVSQDLEDTVGSSKTVAKGAKVESVSLEPYHQPGTDDRVNERRAVTVIASEGTGSLYQSEGSLPEDGPVADLLRMQTFRKEKRSRSSKNFAPTASPNSTESAVASSTIGPVPESTALDPMGDRSIAPSEIYEPMTLWSEQTSPASWTESGQDREVSSVSLSEEEPELDSTVASLENEDEVRLSLDDELAGSDNASSHDLERRNWPVKHSAVVEGDLVLGGLMMVHEREDSITCGPVMPQGGVQALEAMLYTLDWLNDQDFVPGVKIGAHILDDCDKDTYGLEMAVDFIKDDVSNSIGNRHFIGKFSTES